MSSRIGNHIRGNVVGYVAVFLALSGTAAALPGSDTVFSDDIVAGGVRSTDIATGAVKPSDLAHDAVSTGKLANGQVRAADIRAGAVGETEIADGTVAGADVLDDGLSGADIDEGTLFNDDSLGSQDVSGLTGADISDNSIGSADVSAVAGGDLVSNSVTGTQINEETLDSGAGFAVRDGLCNPGGDTSFDTCAIAQTQVSTGGGVRVLVIASVSWVGGDLFGREDTGSCKLTRNGSDSSVPGFSSPMPIGQSGDQHNSDDRASSLSLVGIDTVAPGTHQWALECNQETGFMEYRHARIAAIELGES